MAKATPEESRTRCGYVAIVGRPNAGKSTLVNRILGEPVSAVTPKPQTTRNRILAVHNEGEAQIIFLDTPGLHVPQGKLGEYMVNAAEAAIAEADVIAFLVDAAERGRGEGLSHIERAIAEKLASSKRPVLAVINKVDLLKDKTLLLPILQGLGRVDGIEEMIPLSAATGDGVAILLEQIIKRIPEAPKLYPDDLLTDQAERFLVAEMVREALMDLTREEIPYQTAVVVDQFVEEKERCLIRATIHVAKDSQRGIVVGKGGQMIKAIGQRARERAEKFLGTKVDLMLHVDVTTEWTRTAEGLRKMGYE